MDPHVTPKISLHPRVRVRPAAAVRLVASGSLLAIAGVHLQQYLGEDYRVIPTIGLLFLLNFIGGTTFGVYFLIPAGPRPSRIRSTVDAMAAVAALGLAAGAFVALFVSEHTPLFGFMEHGYRFAIMFAVASEAVAMVALVIQLALIASARRPQRGQHLGRPLAT
jgi:hypothetical protein